MNVYTGTSFTGHWPVGTSAVVVVIDKPQARTLLRAALKKAGLGDANKGERLDVQPVDLSTGRAIILQDGDY